MADTQAPPTRTEHSVHQSDLSQWRTCHAQWAYDKVEGLERAGESPPLVLGTWTHTLLAVDDLVHAYDTQSLIEGGMPSELQVSGRPITIHETGSGLRFRRGGRVDGDSASMVIEAARHWWNREADDLFRQNYVERYRGLTLPEHLHNLLIRYRSRWSAADERDIAILGVEVPWTRTVPGTDLVLAGTVDEIVLDTRLNLVIVRDRKTMQQWPSESNTVLDLMNSQLHLYAWGVSPLIAEAGLGAGARILEWDRIRTKPPTPPQVTKAGNLSKSVTDYDLLTYLAWVESHPAYEGTKASGPGVYQAEESVIEALSTDEARNSFFTRRRFPVNETVLRRHVLMAYDDHVRQADVPPIDRVERSIGRHCQWCDFLLLCKAHMFGEAPVEDYDPEAYGLTRRGDA